MSSTSIPQESSQQTRGPAANPGIRSNYYLLQPPSSMPTLTLPFSRPTRLIPGYSHVDSLPTGTVTEKPTVQTTPGLAVYDDDERGGYADGFEDAREQARLRRESNLVQEMIEPTYEPNLATNNMLPDLVYIP